MENLHFIKDEMLSHIPLCTHAEPKRVLIIGGCEKLQAEVKRHSVVEKITVVEAHKAANEITTLEQGGYDVALVATDEFANDRLFIGLLGRLLDSRGVVVMESSNILTQITQTREELTLLGELFKIVMPYRYETLLESGETACKYLVLASHKYHPTADINLQRADLTDGFSYYNSDIAIGTFQLPTIVRKNYAGLIKI
jgi:spermidine synthase